MRKKWKWIGLTLLILILGTAGYYAYSIYHFAHQIQAKNKDSKFEKFEKTEPVSYKPPEWEGTDRVNVLLLGGDSRGLKTNEVPRSDSIMVASIDPVTKKVSIFSILRDTYVEIPDHGHDRINSALAIGGPNLAMKTVSELLGLPIQYYVYTDFKGFIALIDAIGGIDFDVEKDMEYHDPTDKGIYDIDLKKGYQHLDGKHALQYVRFRHDALSDYTRTGRQRAFLQAVSSKLQSSTSLLKLPKILTSIDPYIETNLSVMDMLKLASLGYSAKTEGIVSEMLPPTNLLQEERINGASVLGVDEEKLQQFVQEKLNPPVSDPATDSNSPANVTPSAESSVSTSSAESIQ